MVFDTEDKEWGFIIETTRVIPACAVTGQAAGTAAALTDDAVSLDISLLKKTLQDQGQKLHIEDCFA